MNFYGVSTHPPTGDGLRGAERRLDTLEKVSGSYVSDDLRDRADDLIWRVRWGEKWLYVYLLLEFQSTIDPWMAVRIQTYVGLLYQDLIRTEQLGVDKRLPPVLPIVLYNGERPWTAPTDVADLIAAVPGRLKAFRPTGSYLLLDEVRLAEGVGHLPTGNLSAALFRLEASHTPADVVALIEALVDWLRAPEQVGLRRAFTVWLTRVFLPKRLPGVDFTIIQDLHEVSDMLSERIDSWEKQWEQRGLQKGLQRGIREGLRRERDLLVRQVRKRFGLAVADESALLLAPIDDADTLGDLAEQLLDSPDGAGWLDAIRSMAPKASGSAGQGA